MAKLKQVGSNEVKHLEVSSTCTRTSQLVLHAGQTHCLNVLTSIKNIVHVHLDKGKFAAALVSVGDGHLSVLVHPPLTTQYIVDA